MTAARIEGHVDGLPAELRVIGEELDFETLGHVKARALLLRSAGSGITDEARRIFSAHHVRGERGGEDEEGAEDSTHGATVDGHGTVVNWAGARA